MRQILALWIACFCCSSWGQEIVRHSFPVQVQGRTFEFPFTGGLDAPQLSKADLNFDGIQDILLFDRVGYVAIPLIADDAVPANYSVDWEVLQHFPDVPLWMLLRDFNGDQVPDIFASTQHPGVQGIDVYRGIKNDDVLTFERMTFDLGQFDLLYIEVGGSFTPMYSAWNDVPSITDVDGDGDLDVLTFEPSGAFAAYYQNLAIEHGLGLDTFLYDWADICWGKFRENDFNAEVALSDDPDECADVFADNISARHSGSALFAYDLDGDGDQDLLLGDLGSSGITKLINGGDATKAFITEQEVAFPMADVPVDIPFFVSPFILDIDNDGLDDFVAASNNDNFSENVDVLWFYKNQGTAETPDFNLVQTDLFVDEMLDFGTESRVAVGDLTNDGLLDMLIGTGGYYDEGLRDARLILLENTGTSDSPAFTIVDEDYLDFSEFVILPTSGYSPDIGDLDSDGDLDIVVGETSGQLFFVENTAGAGNTPQFAPPIFPYMAIDVGSASTPRMVDLNTDGLTDLVIGERIGNNDEDGKCSNLTYFQNVGNVGGAVFEPNETVLPNTQCLGGVLFNGQIAISEFSAPCFYTTSAGDLELLVGSANGQLLRFGDINEDLYGDFRLLDTAYGGIKEGFRTSPFVADMNDDEYLDLVVGNLRGGLGVFSTDIEKLKTASSDLSAVRSLKLYPTLTQRSLTLENWTDFIRLKMFDSSGRSVAFVWQERSITFDLPPGFYMVVAEQPRLKIVGKFVVH